MNHPKSLPTPSKPFTLTMVLATVCFLTASASASVVVKDWQFNTTGDTEGWTAQSWTVNNLDVDTAVQGSETVLTCDNLQNQADPKLYFPNETISLPTGSATWDALTIRLRQIDTDGVTPVAFDDTGTIALYGAGVVPTVNPIATSTDLNATPPVTVVSQSNEWLLITYDLSAYSASFNALTRLDPVAGTDQGGGVIAGNFEIDYVTLTAADPPTPTFYLDAVNGDDTNGDGSSISPWKTLAKAQAEAEDGDTFVLASGNYGAFEEIATESGGWDLHDDWVIYKAADGADVEFESLRIAYTGVAPSDPEFDGFFNAYLRFEGIDILDGVECQFCQHWALVDCLIENYAPWTGSASIMDDKTGVYFRNVKDVLIESCEVTNVVTGISGYGHDISILDNHIHGGSHDGIRVTGFWNSLIEGNRIHDFDDGVTDAEEPTWSRHCDLIHIFIRGNGTEGMQNHNVTFRNNILYDTEAQIVQFNNYYASTLRNEQILFENNIFGPSKANLFNNADPTDGLIFRNNTVVVLDQARTFGRWTLDNYTVRISDESTDVEIYNNILGTISIETGADMDLFDYNLILQPGTPIGVDDSRAYGRFTLIGGDADFVDADAFDGEIGSSSDALNAGTALFAPSTINPLDIDGTTRDNRPDLGAWELPGQSPAAETNAPVYNDTKTIFVDDFEDGSYADVDPWLQDTNTQGLSWTQDSEADFKYYVTYDANYLNRNSLFEPTGVSGQTRSAKLLSVQGDDWADYTLEFTAFNAYLVSGGGPVVLAINDDYYYWIDISRDNGRLIRVVNGTSTVLASDSDIEMPHTGEQDYKISVSHSSGDISIDVDVNADGTSEFNYTDTDSAATAIFTSGGVGFHSNTDEIYSKLRYDDITVTVSTFSSGPANLPPTANAGADQTVTDNDNTNDESVTLDGSASSDSDGTIASYVWEENSSQIATGVGPAVTLSVATHTIDLTVTDDGGKTDSDSVVVTVEPYPNVAPTADAGADQVVTDTDLSGAESATLDGSGSSDSDGTIASYVWEENSSQIATGVSPTVSLALGSHTITLTVTDDDGDSDSDSVVVTVNDPPTADAGADQTVTDYDDDDSESVTLDGSGSSDSDGSIASYAWEESSTQLATGVSPAVALDVATHTIDLTVTDDDGATDTDSVIITVKPAPRVVVVQGDADDLEMHSDGSSVWIGHPESRVGGANTNDGNSIMPFELPTLNAGESITAASLDVSLKSISNSPVGNVDLYGLGYRSSSTVLTTDFFQGAYNTDTTDATAIQAGIADDTSSVGWVASDTTGEANLVSYLNAQYAAGAQGGDYVFLRLNADTDQTNYYYWVFETGDSSNVPELTLTIE